MWKFLTNFDKKDLVAYEKAINDPRIQSHSEVEFSIGRPHGYNLTDYMGLWVRNPSNCDLGFFWDIFDKYVEPLRPRLHR